MPIIYGGKGKLLGGAAVIPWYLAGGLINISSCILAYSAVAGSYAASKVNLINPGTNNLDDTGHNTITWDGIGWKFSATGYFDTGYTMAAGAYTVFFEYTEWNSGYFFGCRANNSTGCVFCRNQSGTTLQQGIRGFGDTQTYASMPAAGKFAWRFDDLTPPFTETIYIDGLSKNLSGAMYPSIGINSISLYLGAMNNAVAAVLTSTMKIKKFSVYAGSLSDAQMAAITNP
jgi:hypothetical protein